MMTRVITSDNISYNIRSMSGGTVQTVGKAKVMRCGNSLVVALPKAWREANGVELGDYLEYDPLAGKEISFSKPRPSKGGRREALRALMGIAARQPDIPWEDDSREADKARAGERYGA